MIQLFVVFHKNIFDDCYKKIPDYILYNYFTFIAVNKNIPKQYTQNKYRVINEWELPVYDNTFQERGYNENSAIYHVYANNLHKDYKYVGFFQYDMTFDENIIDFLQKNANESSYFGLDLYDFNFCFLSTWHEIPTLEFIIKDYSAFFGVTPINNNKYPLCNTYILPTKSYEKIMKWVSQLHSKLYPWCIEPPNRGHFGHIGGIYERIMAFAIGQENLQDIILPITHDHAYKKISY
jgi:hypothetical protein